MAIDEFKRSEFIETPQWRLDTIIPYLKEKIAQELPKQPNLDLLSERLDRIKTYAETVRDAEGVKPRLALQNEYKSLRTLFDSPALVADYDELRELLVNCDHEGKLKLD